MWEHSFTERLRRITEANINSEVKLKEKRALKIQERIAIAAEDNNGIQKAISTILEESNSIAESARKTAIALWAFTGGMFVVAVIGLIFTHFK